jgi:arsenate reductase-like glutaredoxin family protein
MKKIVLPVLFTCIVAITNGQTVKKATSYLEDNQLDKAKSEIDAYLAKKPDDTEASYLKSKIYEKIVSDTTNKYAALVTPDMREQALEAFKKAIADSANMKIKLMIMKDNYQPVFNMYAGYYEEAAKAFNDAATTHNKARFADAMHLFEKANNVGQYIASNKWANIGKVDSTLVLNIGKAALNAGDSASALKYFTQIADARINGVHTGDDAGFVIPYQWLTLHYKDANDEANMLKYAAAGKELFPNDDYFDFVLMDYYREKKDYPGLFKKYGELVVKHPDSLRYHFNYANEIFGYLYNSDEGVVITDKENLLNTLHSEIEKAINIDPNDVNTNWLYAQYYYNLGIEKRDAALKIKGTKPEDVKNKADLNAAARTNFNTAIPYGEKAISILEAGSKKSDKSKYKSIDNLMQNIYQSLEQKDKLKVYQDKYDNADATFVK